LQKDLRRHKILDLDAKSITKMKCIIDIEWALQKKFRVGSKQQTCRVNLMALIVFKAINLPQQSQGLIVPGKMDVSNLGTT
jgi:hypothetical protein